MDLQALCQSLCEQLARLQPARLKRRRVFALNMLLTELLQQCCAAPDKLLDTVAEVRRRLPHLIEKLQPLLRTQCTVGRLADEARLFPGMQAPAREKCRPGELSARHLRERVDEVSALVRLQAAQVDDDSEGGAWFAESSSEQEQPEVAERTEKKKKASGELDGGAPVKKAKTGE